MYLQIHKSQKQNKNTQIKETNKKKKGVTDHLMIFRSKLNNHLFYSLKCPHGGTAKYTQNEGWSKDSFHINHCFKLIFFFHFLLICLSKIISAFNITMRVFSLQSKKYLQHKTDKHGFYFQHRFASSPVSFRLLCFVAQNKNKDPEERQL